ncbi:hypothetical protein BS47DRAFT_1114123 [Hydnum rufescens UP504]|uniref:Uncharacterized protein n=1 Tax=Hydnum rufescens UP504 TaxID=1448309 RepID=A0A9P6AWC0_9AGAM|nr:hypothetical protein BS47DRAFT_1384708 [Hydnum rufescens UP504]KAF9512011.1 hypothetical protein BS47DRAFT_1114123 [Hydnum rufescens UP504]
MAALALSVPLARITSAKTTMTIKGQRRSTASKHRRASDVSLSPSRPIFSQPEHTTQPRIPSPTRTPTLSPDVLASVLVPTPALIDAPNDRPRSEVPSEGSQPQRRKRWGLPLWGLLPEKLLHFDPSKDPRLLAL